MLDAGIVGQENLGEVNKSSIIGIVITGIMRVVLFLAVLGVASLGVNLATSNPPATVFQSAAGDIGYKFFWNCIVGFSNNFSSWRCLYQCIFFTKFLQGYR